MVLSPPKTPVERKPARSFAPPHCPWPDCPAHRATSCEPSAFVRAGSYRRKRDRRRVQRFVCKTCRRTFSKQAFANTYYLKRPELQKPIAAGLVAGSAHRQLARSLGCAPSTVTRQSQRIGRHCLLRQAQLLAQLPVAQEPIVFDHFETFVGSKWTPLGVATAIGQSSWFVYGMAPAPHRRGGRVSVFQKAKRTRQRATEPPTGAYRRSTTEVLDLLVRQTSNSQRITLVTDGHEGYRLALAAHPMRDRFVHEIHPNPKRGPKGAPRSAVAIRRDRAMFASDSLHALWRHSSANNKRRTVAFARRENAMLERGAVFTIWRNLVKGRSERRPDPTTPAMHLGITNAPWTWQQVFSERLFPARIDKPPGLMKIYRREWITPGLKTNTRHALERAF